MRAEAAERRAADASDIAVRCDNERLAKSWRQIANTFQFAESLERFPLDAEKAKSARPPDPPIEGKAGIASQQFAGTVFEPDTIALLSAAYDKAVAQFGGQSPPDPETIAKQIITLASEGERDPDKLCRGAVDRLGPFA
jgi:hypothetical protein